MTRVEKFLQRMPSDFEAALITSEAQRHYLSEFAADEGVLLVTRNRAVLFEDFRYIEAAQQESAGVEPVLTTKIYDQLVDLLKSEQVTKLHIENSVSIREFEMYGKKLGVTIIADGTVTDTLTALRAVKEPREVDAIRSAQAITDAAFEHIRGVIRVGMTQRELAAELEYFMKRNGADSLAFSTIAISGPDTSKPHGVPCDRRIERGDFVTMDYGAKKNGYCSDMTRTVAVGEPSAEMLKVYDTVYKAQTEAMKVAKAGMVGRDLDAVAREIIYSAGYEGCFGHSLGHSLGLEIHESPNASPSYDKPLPVGTIVTIEPGIYIAGKFGVRIENMVLLGESGCENLTASARELFVL